MQTEKGIFVKEGTGKNYANMIPRKECPGWEIFNDAVKDVCTKKKWNINQMLIGLDHALEIQDEVGTISMEDCIMNKFKPLDLEDDVFLSDVMDDNDVFLSKFNAINADFVYLFDVFPDGSICALDYFHSIFHINSMEHISFNLGTIENPREILLGGNCTPEFRERHERILKEKEIAFAWTYEDMPGIDRDIAQYYIPTHDHVKPVKQKLRRMKPEWAQKVKNEVEKQIKEGFLEVIDYPEWLANIVLVPKKNGKVRMCVDYRDLNKASPKDDFPLPHIDVLVDSAAEMLWYACCDGFSGYNQILTAQIHKAKTSFITEWGTFCYKVMPFGLKNTGATDQRAVMTLFHDMMHKEVEIYVDDMVVKAKSEEEYFEALEKFLDRVIKYNLRLNLKKCIFGVGSCKLLGYVVSQRGIKIDPDKEKAIKEMSAPKTETEVRGFLGRLQYISRFIAKLTTVCGPIFKFLRKNQPMIWTKQCQEAFDKIKDYLSNPPILKPPKSRKPLMLYLSIEDQAMGAMLAQEDVGYVEHAVYYLRKLGRWLLLLSEFDIQYIPKKVIKGRAVADFLAQNPVDDSEVIDFSFRDEDIRLIDIGKWKMYFDGAANKSGAGIGVLLVSPEGEWMPLSKRLFWATNNMFEYEACIFGLESLISIGIKHGEIFGDSSLVIKQVRKEWEIKEEKLKPYLQYIEVLKTHFDVAEFKYIPTEENQIADALAGLASVWDDPGRLFVKPLVMVRSKVPCFQAARILDITQDEKPWFHDILRFMQDKHYPVDATTKDRNLIQKLAQQFFLLHGKLYKRHHDLHLLCIDEEKAKQLMEEVHSGVCGPHLNGKELSRKIMR
ncbi:uncharacterized protein LOC126672502 [Mercurialis annua]|uniref:uncharacterized protein LOC126672502 n=1 Tax=Mercurialis annua TaxID=3986 RepID=UPI00215ED0AB|nr:uncharacterized protein LOC126672502 [Mercurialis annua]